MEKTDAASHEKRIIEQFDAQAKSFGKVPGHLAGIDTLARLCGLGQNDEVIDIACGPGLLACEFAKTAKGVTGTDISPVMLEKASARAKEMKLGNMSLIRSDAYALSFPDGSFDIVATRYSMHHMLEPEHLMKEMLRLCRKGGRILVADVCVESSCVEAYDKLELIRDDSHVHALTPQEFESLFARKDFIQLRREAFPIDIDLETQIKASCFKSEKDAGSFRQAIKSDIGRGRLGVAARIEDGRTVYACPILALCGVKA